MILSTLFKMWFLKDDILTNTNKSAVVISYIIAYQIYDVEKWEEKNPLIIA